MILNVYSIFDAKAAVFGLPFFSHNNALAMRNIEAAMMEGNAMFAKFPADFQLYHVGSFDDGTGELRPSNPTIVCSLASMGGRNVS